MQDIDSIRHQLRELRCCVIIPTYNNDKTLAKVIRDVEHYTRDIIVVNDGSTDETRAILASWPANDQMTIISIPANKGKGNALLNGFRAAGIQGFRYAITIDSDGQHFADDIPLFLDKISTFPDAMILGARNMQQDGVPGTSSFGHRFSNFWFLIETGKKVEDVQTGFRLYPLDQVRRIRHFYSAKYEFEVEILVRLAWRGVRIESVPVKIYYAPKGERVSHFRKGTDFARTSLLNSILVFAALLWVRPFHFFRSLRKKSFREFIRENVINSKDSNGRIAWSVAVGVFVGVMPFWGWQTLVAIGLAWLFRLNKLITVVASNISIPPMIPVILFASFVAGGLVLGNDLSGMQYDSGIDFAWIRQNLVQYLVGSVVFGTVLAPVTGITTWLLLWIFRKRK